MNTQHKPPYVDSEQIFDEINQGYAALREKCRQILFSAILDAIADDAALRSCITAPKAPTP